MVFMVQYKRFKGGFKMYTIDDQKQDFYEEDDYDNNWDNRKGLIFKIIIIVICIIVLVLLIKALKSNRSSNNDNGERHIANVEKVRLAAEDYYFIKNNKDNSSSVSLGKLKSEGLINDVVDANDKVCSDSSSIVTLDKEIDTYTMKVNLSCSTNDKVETFYYHRNTLACLNCSGNTRMDGTTVVINTPATPEPTIEEPVTVIADEEESPYKCDEWSEWSKERVNDQDLSERSKTIVLGVKPGIEKTIYGDWSEYSTEKKKKNDNLEVESKVVTEKKWSSNKTGTDIDTNNPNIKVISVETVTETSTINSCNGFVLNNNCYSNYLSVDNLTYQEYNSGNYLIKKDYCDGIKNLKDRDGYTVVTYINCEFNTKIGKATQTITNSHDVYTYQTLESKDVKYYRYRTVETVKEDDVYTDKKYEEDELPEGFTKVDGSEETYYSYRLTYCVK